MNGKARKWMLAAAVAGVVTAAGGIGYAAIPAPDGVINGCYKNKAGEDDPNGGQLRVVESAADCKQNETPISWNEKGPKGDQGVQGIQGVQGERGPEGLQGERGQQGLQGEPGAPGADGHDGAPGAPGADGQNGQDGVSVTSEPLAAGDANCDNGGSKFTAANGVTYACNGAPGQDGQDGIDGQDGAQGPPGPAGISDYHIVTARTPMRANAIITAHVDCPANTLVFGGGGSSSQLLLPLQWSGPTGASGWAVSVFNNTASTGGELLVWAICAHVES